jgi:hypothetical protein
MVIHHGREYTVMTNDPPYPAQLADLKRYKSFSGTIEELPGGNEPDHRFCGWETDECSRSGSDRSRGRRHQKVCAGTGRKMSRMWPIQAPRKTGREAAAAGQYLERFCSALQVHEVCRSYQRLYCLYRRDTLHQILKGSPSNRPQVWKCHMAFRR